MQFPEDTFETIVTCKPVVDPLELSHALENLTLEAMHFRNTGHGVQFLNQAIEKAMKALKNYNNATT